MRNIWPKNYYKVDKVKVYSNSSQIDNFSGNNLRYSFRITVLPYRTNQVSYLELTAKGYQSAFEIYKLNNNR